jgi:starvation-inducible outer membrane lipoprotein
MRNRGFSKFISLLLILFFIFQITGCATIPEAIEYRNLYTNYKMSDTIFLDVTKKIAVQECFC